MKVIMTTTKNGRSTHFRSIYQFKAIYSRARGHEVKNDITVLILYNKKQASKSTKFFFLMVTPHDKLLN